MIYLEAAIGAVFAVVASLAVVGLCAGIFFEISGRYRARGEIPAGILTAIIAICELFFLTALKGELDSVETSFAPTFAIGFRQCPSYTRPLATLWWTLHFLIAVFLSMGFEKVIFENTPDWDARARQILLFMGLDFAAAYPANLYAMLALAAAGCGESSIHRMWRWRFAVDLGIAVGSATIPFLWK